MVDVFSNVENFFLKHNLITKKNIAVAFSGGFDSMCLLDIVIKLSEKYEFKVFALHLNHNWRGQESFSEAENCESFCQKHNVKFYSEILSFDCPKTETAARDARYNFFNRCVEKYDLDVVLTAHNANDNAETVLYRIAKGTGIVGLQGIVECRKKLYRPLILTKRIDIEKYCCDNNLQPNSDSSNENVKYKRNLIRKNILPEFEKINKNAIDAINSLSKVSNEDNSIIEEYLSIIRKKIMQNGNFSAEKFVNLSKNIQKRLIYSILIENNIDYDYKTIEKLTNFINENSKNIEKKKMSLNANSFLVVNSKNFEIMTFLNIEDFAIDIDKCGKYSIYGKTFLVENCDKNPEKFPKDSEQIVYCDLSNLKYPYTLRNRRDGDYIYPFGVIGKQKLKKYLNAKKIPENKRDGIILLAKGSEIFWVVGFGISEKIKVVSKPTNVLRLL